VRVFFALSGFLITRILLKGETGNLGRDLKRYYIRRTLRIFPLYYLIIAVIWSQGELTNAAWFLTYTANIKAYLDASFNRMLGHFWTLAVEEQFYVLYPLLLLLTPRRGRGVLLVLLIAGSVGFQVYAHRHLSMPWAKWLLPYCLEDLAWGGLAGWVELRTRSRKGLGTACVLVGVPLLILAWRLNEQRISPLSPALQADVAPTVYGLGSSLLVFGLWRTSNPLLVWPLSLAPIAYLGRISYGLYAWHIPVVHGGWTFSIPFAFYIPQPYRDLLWTIALASLSWHLYEKPINRLKDRWAPA
jgi:peptidoglycan/LPS O-acetylase OafA/YrhL